MAQGLSRAARPDVSVVIPVHNCVDYIDDALSSVYHQSLGRELVEVIAVDDGSTDGSSEALARWAERWDQLTIVTQAASGSAGGPRNVGIGRASGEYVFFLDADDALGPEALERLLAMARANDSDVVLAKLVGVRRRVPRGIFAADVATASLTSGIYYTLMPFKLLRRSMLDEHGIRFPEGLRISEDQPFMLRCYLAARVISILGSYDCYYLVQRTDGTNTSAEGLDFRTRVQQADDMVSIIRAALLPPAVEAHLIARHVSVELLRRFDRGYLGMSGEEQADQVGLARSSALTWVRDFTPQDLERELSVSDRLLLHALQQGDTSAAHDVVRWAAHGSRARRLFAGGQWLLAGPGFRTTAGPPDAWFATSPPAANVDVDTVAIEDDHLLTRGRVVVRGVGSEDREVTLVLRHRGSGRKVTAPGVRLPSPEVNVAEGVDGALQRTAGFEARLPLLDADLAPGTWRLRLSVLAEGLDVDRPVPLPETFEDQVRQAPLGSSLSGSRLTRNERGVALLRVRPRRAAVEPPAAGGRILRTVRRVARRGRRPGS